MEQKATSKSIKRWLTGLIFGLTALTCLISGGFLLLFLVLIIICLAAEEYVKMLENKGFYPSIKIILLADFLFTILAYFNFFKLVPLAFTIGTTSAFLWVLFRGRQPYIANVATTILGFVYTGWFPLHLLFLRNLSSDGSISGNILKLNINGEGLGFVIFLFVLIILTDIGGYYVGRFFGKHKLAPVISPNKTVEGSIGGIICALMGAFIVGHFINLLWYQSLISGLLITVFAQLGDLSESLIKRDAGVKDSGDSLPGHGGFLDRTDSFIFTIPFAYYYFNYFVISNRLWTDFTIFLKGLF